jgi:hypothetical protein
VTRKQAEALERIKANIATMPRRSGVDITDDAQVVVFYTGENTNVLDNLRRAGHIKARHIYLGGKVADLEVV